MIMSKMILMFMYQNINQFLVIKFMEKNFYAFKGKKGKIYVALNNKTPFDNRNEVIFWKNVLIL